MAFKHGRVYVGGLKCMGVLDTAGAKTHIWASCAKGLKWRVWVTEQQTKARNPLGSLQQERAILKMGLSREVANLWSAYNYFYYWPHSRTAELYPPPPHPKL